MQKRAAIRCPVRATNPHHHHAKSVGRRSSSVRDSHAISPNLASLEFETNQITNRQKEILCYAVTVWLSVKATAAGQGHGEALHFRHMHFYFVFGLSFLLFTMLVPFRFSLL
jgi:hypothetical protein